MIPLRQITVDVPDCPETVPMVAGIPSWVVGWGFALCAVLLLAVIITGGIVRYHAHEEKTRRLRDSQNRKTCLVCGAVYPTDKMVR